jgi:hypothetical protein
MLTLRLLFAVGLLAGLSAASTAQDRPAVDRAKLQADLRALEKYYTQSLGDVPLSRELTLPKVSELVRRVKLLPEGDELRREAIALALRHAKVIDMASDRKADVTQYRRDHHRLYFAWALLVELNVLHPGMTVEEAVAILGPTTSVNAGDATWYYPSPMHVNPVLHGQLKDGRIQLFKQGRA